MERRILLALALSFLLVLATRTLWEPKKVPETPVARQEEPSNPTEENAPKSSPLTKYIPSGVKSDVPESKKADAEAWTDVETDLIRVRLSNKEGVAHSWILKKYTDSNGKPLEFIDEAKSRIFGYPLSLKIEQEEDLTKLLKSALFVSDSPRTVDLTRQNAQSHTVSFEYADGNVHVTKNIQFFTGSYVVEVQSSVSVNGKPSKFSDNWSSGFGDSTVDTRMAVHRALYLTADKIKRIKNTDITEEQEMSGSFGFVGLEDLYFTALFLPVKGDTIRRFQLSQNEHDLPGGKKDKLLRVGAYMDSQKGGTIRLFVGPKDQEVLKKTEPYLVSVIDYGWFRVVCEPLFIALKWIYSYVGNYGLAIVILTLLINLALFPLKYKSIVSAQKMQKVQPQMKAIQDRYKKLKPTDPKRQQMNAEVMALYKEHGVNPLGGCLPLVLQMPFFIAFYNLLSVSIELRHAPFILWIRDLSAADHTYILPILMTVSMVVMQKMTPTPSTDPVQAKIMLAMPVFFGFMLAFTSSGLVLYWLTSNAAGIVQQYFMNKYRSRMAEVPAKRPHKKRPSRAE